MKKRDIKTIGVAGSGTMGASIAQIFAMHDFDVTIYDINETSLANAKEFIKNSFENMINNDMVTKQVAEDAIVRISYTLDLKKLAECDFISESIIEKLDIKQKFWENLSKLVKEGTILTTNTSGLSINDISKNIDNKVYFAGYHWVNPPHLVPLVEIIKGSETSDSTVEIIKEISYKISKKPVVINKDVSGFLLNRIQFAVLREALHIVENNIADAKDVDSVLKHGLGFRYAVLGPFETADLGGLDTFNYISNYLFKELSAEKTSSKLLSDLVESGNYGIKSGKGFYDYSEGKGKKVIEDRDKKFIKMLKNFYM